MTVPQTVPGRRADTDDTRDEAVEAAAEMAAEDLDAQSPAADLVRVYLNGIGKTALLTAAQEVDLAKRIEAGVFAQHVLDSATAEGLELDPASTPRTCASSSATASARATTCWRPTSGWSCRSPSATRAAACRCWT